MVELSEVQIQIKLFVPILNFYFLSWFGEWKVLGNFEVKLSVGMKCIAIHSTCFSILLRLHSFPSPNDETVKYATSFYFNFLKFYATAVELLLSYLSLSRKSANTLLFLGFLIRNGIMIRRTIITTLRGYLHS